MPSSSWSKRFAAGRAASAAGGSPASSSYRSQFLLLLRRVSTQLGRNSSLRLPFVLRHSKDEAQDASSSESHSSSVTTATLALVDSDLGQTRPYTHPVAPYVRAN